MAFDFKKEEKNLYRPKTQPEILTVPAMQFLAVRGTGDPNAQNGAYQTAVELLYGAAYAIKMGGKKDPPPGYFEYVVPPLEGFWKVPGNGRFDRVDKSGFSWISVIRLPDFVTETVFSRGIAQAEEKKKQDFSAVEFLKWEEGLCVQAMHLGPFDKEEETVARMDAYLAEQGYENDFTDTRMHHEIYLSDPRKLPPERWKTVLRHPVRKKR